MVVVRGRQLLITAALLCATVLAAPAVVAVDDGASGPSPFRLIVDVLIRPTPSVGEPAGVAIGRLPRCGVGDEPTRFGRVREWRWTLLDTNLRIDVDYEPWDLVSVRRAGIAGSGRIRRIVIEDLAAMADAARDAGKPLGVRSAYRSFATQKAIFQREARRVGRRQARKFVARPGHSEHQLGTTIDFTAAAGGSLSQRFGTSPAGRWIARHGWKYGFVLSYPKGKKRASCYGYEPWHWRYVGRELARAIHESGQVPRRYLWEHHESADAGVDDMPATLP